MKVFLKSNLLISLLITFFVLSACETTGDEDPDNENDPNEVPELADLVGRWGITETANAQGTDINPSPCRNTLEIHSSGNFLFVDVDRGEWLEGYVQFDPADSSITLTAGTEIFEMKLIAIGETGFDLRFENDENGTISVNTQKFIDLGDEDCAAFTSADLTKKWSINAFSQERYAGDNLEETLNLEEITPNLFTIEFRPDGSAHKFDYVNEYNYEEGAFRMLDNHNLVVDFDLSDDDPGSLVHLENVQWPYWIFETIEHEYESGTDGDLRMVTTFSLTPNTEEIPVIGAEALMGKWSATLLSEKFYRDSKLAGEDNFDDLPHNKLTLQLKTDGTYYLIDLVRSVNVMQGDYQVLDGSNIMLDLSEHHNGDEDDKDCPDHLLFHLNMNEGDQTIRLINYQSMDEEDGERDFELETFELTLTKNSGQEPSITAGDLQGQWEITETENLSNSQSAPDEGPQVGMIIQFGSEGDGNVSFQQSEVASLSYSMLDESNLMVSFIDEEDGDGEEEDRGFSIFHMNAREGDRIEYIIYEPEGRDGPEEERGGAMFRVVLKKL